MSRHRNLMVAVITATIFSFSCENEKDFFKIYNKPAVIKFSVRGKPYSDSLVDSIKVGFPDTCKLQIKDEYNTIKISYSDNSQPVDFKVENLQITGSGEGKAITTTTGEKGIVISSNTPGRVEGLLSFTDVYDEVTSKQVILTFFTNLSPVTNLKISPIKVVSPYEILIDLSQSYDRDASQGGKIVEYEYRVGDFYILNTTKFSSIKFILPESGSYLIRCRVKDNNGEWSEEVNKNISVE